MKGIQIINLVTVDGSINPVLTVLFWCIPLCPWIKAGAGNISDIGNHMPGWVAAAEIKTRDRVLSNLRVQKKSTKRIPITSSQFCTFENQLWQPGCHSARTP